MAGLRNNIAGTGYGSVYIDSLIWGGTAWDHRSGPIKVWFGSSADFEAASEVHGSNPFLTSADEAQDWTHEEAQAFGYAASRYVAVCGLSFTAAESVQDADIVWWKTEIDGGLYGWHETPHPNQAWGLFNPHTDSWANLAFGGDGLNTIVHEIGHGLGLAHPHDGGTSGDGNPFPGVTDGDSGDTGDFGFNQGIWSVMSYNTGWDGAYYTLAYGAQGGLGAFDIAALQALYGVNSTTAQGNDTYTLPTQNVAGTGWACIWDTGGVDLINGASARGAMTIDLRAATLVSGDPNAGGYISRQAGIAGGFTIARGVTIENAVGGAYGDTLIGNSVGNMPDGGPGSDIFVFSSKAGKDRIVDFSVSDDTIHLENGAYTKPKAGKLSKRAFWTGKKAHDKSDRVIYDKKKGVLSYDADGSGKKKAVEIAQLDKKLKLTVDDILVI